MTQFVLDASITLAWFLDKPVAVEAEQVRKALLRGRKALVPSLWQLEVANGLVVAERRKIIPSDDAMHAVALLETLLGSVVEESTRQIPFRHVHHAALNHRLTAYDAMYLELARAEGLELATLDRSLGAAAEKSGVKLFP